MNISRRIKLLGAAGALTLSTLAGLATGIVPAQAATVPGPIQWHPPVTAYLSSMDCRTFIVTGNSSYSDVTINLYEETNMGPVELEVPGYEASPTVSMNGSYIGMLNPYSLPPGLFGTGEYWAFASANGFGISSAPVWC